MPQTTYLPLPDTAALAHQQNVFAHIQAAIVAASGQISFANFMDMALYAPGLGYYSNGAHKLGAGGDFTTAPELSPLFSRTLARQCQQILTQVERGEILELGAGSGIMAAEILLELERQNCLPQRYAILDLSADLRQRQQQTLLEYCPHLLTKVVWLDSLPTVPFNGIILANEVVDAMPVHKFQCDDDGIAECYVGIEQNQFCWHLGPLSSARLAEKIDELETIEGPYISEININLEAWIASIAATLQQGIMVIIDYGFPEQEYYHPQRSQGTLMCHYQQRAHTDPLILVGLQDITTHVDFTALAKAAVVNGLEVAGYTSQTAFLLACGIHEMMGDISDLQQHWANSNAIKKLTLPSEMGELFKVMALSKNLDIPLLGFSWQDRRMQL
ncbi:SAM-dependent methyltransferase [soil metagenome]